MAEEVKVVAKIRATNVADLVILRGNAVWLTVATNVTRLDMLQEIVKLKLVLVLVTTARALIIFNETVLVVALVHATNVQLLDI